MSVSTQEATNYLANVPYIHNGGCLVSALAFYLNEKTAGRADNLQLVQFEDTCGNDEYIDTNKAYFKGKAKKAVSGMHFGWTFDGGKTAYDCNGQNFDYDEWLLVPKHLTEKFALSSLNNGGWNYTFDRKKYTPQIAEKFGIDLSKVHLNTGRTTGDLGGTFKK